MRNLLLVIHILAAAAWIGGGLTLGFLNPRVLKSGKETARNFYAMYEGLGKIYFNIAGITVLLSGVLLVLDGVYEFEDTFVIVGIVLVVIGALIGAFGFGPTAQKIVAAYDSDDDEGVATLTRRFSTIGVIDSLLLITAVVAMVYKWGVG